MLQHNIFPEAICSQCNKFCYPAIWLHVTKWGDVQRPFCDDCACYCEICDERYASSMSYKHDDCYFRCYDCNALFKSQDEMEPNRLEGRGEEYLCAVCDKLYGYCSFINEEAANAKCDRPTMMNDLCERHQQPFDKK